MAKSKTTPTPVPIDRNTAVNVFGNVAQTNYYLVSFSGFGKTGLLGGLTTHLQTKFDVNINIDVNNLSISKLDFDCNYEKKQPINLGALMQNNKSSEQGPKDLTQE